MKAMPNPIFAGLCLPSASDPASFKLINAGIALCLIILAVLMIRQGRHRRSLVLKGMGWFLIIITVIAYIVFLTLDVLLSGC
jgi:hypothetical protein